MGRYDRAIIKVAIVYPTDPLAVIPGGTDTCIRDILRFAPEDIDLTLYGVTTDPINRPINRITRCTLENSVFDFIPIQSYASLKRKMRLPLSARYTMALLIKRIEKYFDILQFHRIEPAFRFIFESKPKIFFIHQNKNILYNKNSDVRWKHCPQVYCNLENFVLSRAEKTFIVREDAAKEYQRRYPEIVERFQFLPTWLNPNIFYPIEDDERKRKRIELFRRFNWESDDIVFISVGRIDSQKNPMLLINAFAMLAKRVPGARLVVIGDGVLRNRLEKSIAEAGLCDSVKVMGALEQKEMVQYLQISDAMILSSAYEGMPRCVVEALGCGLPVVSTDVGEVVRVVHSGRNGFVVADHRTDLLSSAMEKIACNPKAFSGKPCLDAVKDFSAPVILERVYDSYRHLTK